VKCVRNIEDGRIRRVNELEALRLVLGDDDGEWVYERKSAWKAQQKKGLELKSESNNE